jgi:hypothetical protein
MDRVELGQVSSENFGFCCHFSFQLLHNHPSSGASTIGQLVADLPRGLSLTPPHGANTKARLSSGAHNEERLRIFRLSVVKSNIRFQNMMIQLWPDVMLHNEKQWFSYQRSFAGFSKEPDVSCQHFSYMGFRVWICLRIFSDSLKDTVTVQSNILFFFLSAF